MKTLLEKLLETYPNLQYEDGYLYKDTEIDGTLHDNFIALDGKRLIEDHFEGHDICTNPEEPDPTKEIYAPASGREVINYWYNGDYNKAIKSLK